MTVANMADRMPNDRVRGLGGLVWLALLWSGVLHADTGLLAVWDVESPVFNAVGGSYNAYGSDGCEVVLQRTRSVHRGPAGHALKITYHNVNAVSCGTWIHLFREGGAATDADFIDTTRFPYLSFWIRRGGNLQDVEVRMADSVWLSRDDSKVAGRASQYLRGQADDGWGEVVIPFRDFHLPTSRAAVVALQFVAGSSGVLYLDDICFKGSAELSVAYSGAPAAAPVPTRQRAMWLWETTKFLTNADFERDAFATLRDAHVTDLFLQIPHQTAGDGDLRIVLKAELRRCIKTAHANRIRVHALEGDPEFSLRDRHELVLSAIRNVVAFNLSGSPEERFDGVHLDNEPYQLLGFDGPSRGEILREYLELNEKVAMLLRSEPRKLSFGVDIPFWWDSTGGGDQACCLVEFKGISKSAAHHIIDLVDNVGIMAYRNFAGGLDGIVNHAQGVVDYAGQRGKQAFVAIETYQSPPEKVIFVAAIKESQWQILPADARLLRLSRFQGYPLRTFSDGVHRYIGLADKNPAGAGQNSFEEAIGSLRRALPGRSADWISDLRDMQGAVDRYGRISGEWRGVSFSPLDKLNGAGSFGLSVMQEMPPKITLANRTRGFVDEILGEVGEAFGPHSGFAGDAIHSLESYQKLRTK